MSAAGFRIVDLRNPANPVEVAYFQPGASCSGFERADQIWMTCGAAGFYVLGLTPEVRAALRRRR